MLAATDLHVRPETIDGRRSGPGWLGAIAKLPETFPGGE
jgi:hypothetical protein